MSEIKGDSWQEFNASSWCHPKGQLISKCLFGVFKFFQKTNENKSTWDIIVVKSDFFVRFLEELRITKSPCKINWPLTKSYHLTKGLRHLHTIVNILSNTTKSLTQFWYFFFIPNSREKNRSVISVLFCPSHSG